MSVSTVLLKRNCDLVIHCHSVYEKGLALQMLATFQKPLRPMSYLMTHAAKGQRDTKGLEFRRIKMGHGQWHALRASAVHGGCVCRGLSVEEGGARPAHLFTEGQGAGDAGAEPGWQSTWMTALQGGGGATRAQVRGITGLRHQHGKCVIEDRGSFD